MDKIAQGSGVDRTSMRGDERLMWWDGRTIDWSYKRRASGKEV